MRPKITRLGVVFLLCFLFLAGRLYQLQIVNHQALMARAESQRVRSVQVAEYPRGNFLDRFGRKLTGNSRLSVVVFPGQIANIDVTAQAVAHILQGDAAELTARLQQSVRSATLPQPFFLTEEVSELQAGALQQASLPGVFVLPVEPRYATPALAAHLIGFVGEGGQDSAFKYVGKSGLEQQYDAQLQGRQSAELGVVVDAQGRQTEDGLRRFQPQGENGGCDVCLTLDWDYQRIAEQAMGSRKGAVVLMDVSTGDVRALVSTPTFDPCVGQVDGVAGDLYVNKALAQYPPASLFKLVLVTATLDLGLAAPTDFNCTGQYVLPNGQTVACWHKQGHGVQNLEQALANSCNPYFVNLGQMLGGDTIKGYVASLGLREQQLLGYKLPKSAVNLDFNSRVPGDVANVSIGEKGIRLSPLQLCQMFAQIGGGGKSVTPRIVTEVRDVRGRVVEQIPSAQSGRLFSEQTAATICQYLGYATTDGTGKPAASRLVTSGGKTGTSEHQGVWYGGIFPLEQPQFALVVYDAEGQAGGRDCGGVFREIMEQVGKLAGLVP